MTLTIIILTTLLALAIIGIRILTGRVNRLYDIIEQQKQLIKFWYNECENDTDQSAKA